MTVSVEKLKINPVAIWLENVITLDKDKEILFRWKPKQIAQKQCLNDLVIEVV